MMLTLNTRNEQCVSLTFMGNKGIELTVARLSTRYTIGAGETIPPPLPAVCLIYLRNPLQRMNSLFQAAKAGKMA